MRFIVCLLFALAATPVFAQNIVEQKSYRNVPRYHTISSVTVEFPNGYRTQVYVLDGFLPQVAYCSSGGCVQIVCNYGVRYPFNHMRTSNGAIRYDLITSGAQKNPEPPRSPSQQTTPQVVPQRPISPQAPSRLDDEEIDWRFIPKARNFVPNY